nr:MAG TPA: hypothetical protein [Caudoviricetes sp.]
MRLPGCYLRFRAGLLSSGAGGFKGIMNYQL